MDVHTQARERIEDVAAMHDTTTEVIWSAVRQRMPHAPAAPVPLAWTRPDVEPQVVPVPEVRQVNAQHPLDRVLSALRARGSRIQPKRDAQGRESKRATCPAHDDVNPSLVVTADGPNVLIYCFGGCPASRVVAALGLKLADLFSGPPQAQVPRRRRTHVAKPAPAPKLSAEERLARKRLLTADRTRRWRERRQTVEPVTHQNIRSVTVTHVTLGDAPNVLPVTSHDESSFTSSDLEAMTATREEDPTVIELSTEVCRAVFFEVGIHSGGDDDDAARA